MVAPTPDAPRRRKWRLHCSTCGAKFGEPQTWAYCSKHCEESRRGQSPGDPDCGDGAWLVVLHEERLRLHEQLEIAPHYQRAAIVAKILANEAKEAAVRADLAKISAPRDSAQFWIQAVRRASDQWELWVRRSLSAAIALGKSLLRAKEALPHGEFGRLFAEHENAVDDAMKLSPRWAQKLMTIAANAAIAEASAPNATHATHLPADVETVYLLARLPDPELRAAMEDGRVSADMRRADARELLPARDGDEAAEPVDDVAKVLDPICRALRRFAAEHKGQEFGELKARLRAALRAIERDGAEGEVRA